MMMFLELFLLFNCLIQARCFSLEDFCKSASSNWAIFVDIMCSYLLLYHLGIRHITSDHSVPIFTSYSDVDFVNQAFPFKVNFKSFSSSETYAKTDQYGNIVSMNIVNEQYLPLNISCLTRLHSLYIESCDYFLAVKVDNVFIFNLYLPTECHNDASEWLFTLASELM